MFVESNNTIKAMKMYKNLEAKAEAEARAARTIKMFKIVAVGFIAFFAIAAFREFGLHYFI